MRFVSALLTALIVAAFLALLRGPARQVASVHVPTVSVMVLIPRALPAPDAPPQAVPETKLRPHRLRVEDPAVHQRAAMESPQIPAAEASAIAEAKVPAAPDDAASAPKPLDLSVSVIRSAAAQSKGSVRALAGGSGTELDSPTATKSDQYAAAVAESAVPDCLGADATRHDRLLGPVQLGGLLSVPLRIHAALTGKCR